MSEIVEIELEEEMQVSIVVCDKAGRTCKLVRRYVEWTGEWMTACTVRDENNLEVFHTGNANCEFSKAGGLGMIELYIRLAATLDQDRESGEESRDRKIENAML